MAVARNVSVTPATVWPDELFLPKARGAGIHPSVLAAPGAADSVNGCGRAGRGAVGCGQRSGTAGARGIAIRLRRRVVEAVRADELEALALLKDITELYRIEREADARGFSARQRGYWRHGLAKPVLKRLQRRFLALSATQRCRPASSARRSRTRIIAGLTLPATPRPASATSASTRIPSSGPSARPRWARATGSSSAIPNPAGARRCSTRSLGPAASSASILRRI